MIDCADKTTSSSPLYDMFNAIPPRYDLTNHVITWGLDKRWRQEAAKECAATHPGRMLDLCCGTGGLTLNLASLLGENTEITGLDYSQAMLDIAASKAAARGRRLSFIHGDAASLPFPDGCFDCVGISFAFRNLTYKNPLVKSHIGEVLRVLSHGGRFVIVETSQPKLKPIRALYHLYLRWFVRNIGSLLSSNRGAYHYLAESAARFYTPDELAEMLVTAGFHQVSFRPLFFGAVGIHTAIK